MAEGEQGEGGDAVNRYGGLWDQVVDWSNLVLAAKKARRVPDAGLIRYAVTDAGDHEELLSALVALPPRKSAWAWSASSAALYPVPFAAPLSSSMTSWTFEADFALCASITSRNPFTRS